jgi:hypothetical protein
VPEWPRTSFINWLRPVLFAEQRGRYLFHTTPGISSPELLQLAERKLRVSLDWRNGTAGALNDLVERMYRNDDLFLQVLGLAIEHIDTGYSFQQQDEALAALDRILTEAGSVWRVSYCRNVWKLVAGSSPRGVRVAT